MVKKIIILDVEGMSGLKPYNVGWVVADKRGNIYEKYNFALMENIATNWSKCFNCPEMTHKNINEILLDTVKEVKKYEVVSNVIFKEKLLNCISENKITEIWAYNKSFDENAIKRIFEVLPENVKFFDIMTAIVSTKLTTKRFANWCINNGYVTSKGNIQTKAENVYQYLTGKENFKEEHTGLADCLIEYEILMYAVKTKKKLEQGFMPWRRLKDFCNSKEIVVN